MSLHGPGLAVAAAMVIAAATACSSGDSTKVFTVAGESSTKAPAGSAAGRAAAVTAQVTPRVAPVVTATATVTATVTATAPPAPEAKPAISPSPRARRHSPAPEAEPPLQLARPAQDEPRRVTVVPYDDDRADDYT